MTAQPSTAIAEARDLVRQFAPAVTDEEITQLLDGYVREGAKKLPGYVRYRQREGQLGPDLETVRADRKRADSIRIIDNARIGPPCQHGVPGGESPHPETRLPLCPHCRRAAASKNGTPSPSPETIGTETAGNGENGSEETAAAGSHRLILTPASEIAPRPVLWGWEDRLPAAHVSLIAGREGIGKSLFLIDLTAQITQGKLPGAFEGQPRPVIYCATEDSWAHTIIPRLIAAGANRDFVYRAEVEKIEASTGTSAVVELSLPAHCDVLAAKIKELSVAMVALDPLMSAIDRSVDTYNDRDMRTVLEPLSKLADETGSMIVGLGHFNKSGDVDPLNLITGSRAFTAVVRAVIAMARDPQSDNGQFVISQVKNNLGKLDLPNMTYVIQSAVVETDEGNAHVGRIHFTGESQRSVRDILAESGTATDRTERAECAEWLREELADGPRRTKEILAAGKECSFSQRTQERARKLLGIKPEQLPTGPKNRNEWWLSLPQEGAS